MRKPAVCVVLTEHHAILGSAGKHAIGFIDATCHKIVGEYSHVCRLATQNKSILVLQSEGGTCACYQALSGRFFVAGCAIDLTSKEEPLDGFGFEPWLKLVGWAKIVFDCIAITHDLGVFQTWNHAHHLILNVAGQGGRNAVYVDLKGVASLGFEEQLMTVLVRETNHFVLDRRTIAWAGRLDLARVHRCTMQIGADQGVNGLIGISDPARHLRTGQRVRHE